jgi:hypothetical protein
VGRAEDRRLRAAPQREHEHLPQRHLARLSAPHAHPHRRRPQLYRAGQRRRQVARRDDRERSLRAPLLCRPRSHRHAKFMAGEAGSASSASPKIRSTTTSANPRPAVFLRALPPDLSHGHESGLLCPHARRPENVLSTLRAQARDLDPNVTVFDAVPLKEFIGASLYPQKSPRA